MNETPNGVIDTEHVLSEAQADEFKQRWLGTLETYYKVRFGSGPVSWWSVHCFDTLEAAERYSADSNGQGIRKFTVTAEDVS